MHSKDPISCYMRSIHPHSFDTGLSKYDVKSYECFRLFQFTRKDFTAKVIIECPSFPLIIKLPIRYHKLIRSLLYMYRTCMWPYAITTGPQRDKYIFTL